MTRFTILSGLFLFIALIGSSPADEPVRDVRPEKNSKRVAYVCDASKSMKDKLAVFRPELIKAIESLKPEQSFTIIFQVDGKAVALGKDLLPASAENKAKAVEFVKKVVPAGASASVPGLRAAFACKPDVIYFTTDGDFADRDRAIAEARALNKDKHVRINTIAVFDREEAYMKVLKQLADENGGLFKFVSKEDLEP